MTSLHVSQTQLCPDNQAQRLSSTRWSESTMQIKFIAFLFLQWRPTWSHVFCVPAVMSVQNPKTQSRSTLWAAAWWSSMAVHLLTSDLLFVEQQFFVIINKNKKKQQQHGSYSFSRLKTGNNFALEVEHITSYLFCTYKSLGLCEQQTAFVTYLVTCLWRFK